MLNPGSAIKRAWKASGPAVSLKAWARVTAGSASPLGAAVVAWLRRKAHGVNPSRHRN